MLPTEILSSKSITKQTQKMTMRGSFTLSMALSLITLLVTHNPIVVRAQPVNVTTLRIAVPPKSGFTQFVKIVRDPVTGTQNFSGFAIEVFNQAKAATVDRSTIFNFVSFERPDGTMNGSYDDMVEAVYNKDYDGAVGDITIRFSRTGWVDFTVPYTDIGISMLIPLRQQASSKEANSLAQLRQQMLIGTFVIFFLSILVFLGADILHLVFGGTRAKTEQPTRPPGGEEMREMLGVLKGTRLMMLLLFMILLFLITYYATSLFPLLSIEQSSAPSKSLNQLIRTGENVGYYKGAFLLDMLKGYGLSEKQLFAYNSEAELLNMLSKGNTEGGVTVAIDETPPLSVFLSQHCNKFTLVSLNNLHAAGYGFAFPIGSDLVRKVSKGIIKLIDSGELGRIQARTIGGKGTCDVEPNIDVVSQDESPNYPRTFRACAIVSVVLFVIIYLIFIITTNRQCLRYLFP